MPEIRVVSWNVNGREDVAAPDEIRGPVGVLLHRIIAHGENMRLIADRPIDIIASVVRQHLPAVYPNPVELAWLSDPEAPHGALSGCFDDVALTTPADLSTPTRRVVFNPRSDDPNTLVVVASLAVETASKDGLLLIQEDMTPLFAVHATASLHPDGVIQLFGGEAGVVVLTPSDIRDQVGNRSLIRGTPIKGFAAQSLDEAGTWVQAPVKIESGVIQRLKLD